MTSLLTDLEKLINSELSSKIKSSIIENNELLVETEEAELLDVVQFLKTHEKYEDIFSGLHDLDVTTGASNDLIQANKLARDYITRYGFGETQNYYGPQNSEQPFMGRDLTMSNDRVSYAIGCYDVVLYAVSLVVSPNTTEVFPYMPLGDE